MFWCCCEQAETCGITGVPATTVQGLFNVSTASHPNTAVVGWTSRGRLVGTATLSNSSSIIEIAYAWKDTANYDYLRCQRGAGASDWVLTLISRRSNVETQLQFRSLTAPTVGITWCVQWNGTDLSLSVGNATGTVWHGIVQFTGAPTLTNAGKVGYRSQSGGTMTIQEWWRHYTEGPLGGQQCPACVGAGACEGCCVALSNAWTADLSAFNLTNANFTGCVDVDGVYVLDQIINTTCEFQATRRLQRYEYAEPQIGAINCYSRDLNGISCFDPSIRVYLRLYKLAGVCTLDLTISISWAAVGVPCDTCQFSVIGLYRAQSATVDDLCNGSVTLNYVTKDPQICAGNPPATVTVTGA